MEGVSAVRISTTVAVAGMTKTSTDLDDDVGARKPEVDASDGLVVPPKHHLTLRARKAKLAQEPQESSLEVRLAS